MKKNIIQIVSRFARYIDIMPSILELLKKIMSTSFRTTIKGAYLRVFGRYAYREHRDYRYTDEHLKLVHILEAINYTNIAKIPAVYFEFCCHSGRTFSAAVRAARYLRIKDAQFFAFDSFQGLPGTNKGEALALKEFCLEHPSFSVEEWKTYSTFGKSFFVTSLP